MASIRKNQRGFSAIEGVLVTVIVIAVALVGWYVYHTKHTSDKAFDAATTTSNNAGPRFKSSKTPAQTSAASTTGTDNQSLQTDLNGATGASNQSNQELSGSNSGLNDQSTFTSVP